MFTPLFTPQLYNKTKGLQRLNCKPLIYMVRPKRFELLTPWFAENNSLVLGEEEWTPHDLRRTGATMMQQLKVPRDVINLCQNHVIGSKVDRVYLLNDYADDKRVAWQKLGGWLSEILDAQ